MTVRYAWLGHAALRVEWDGNVLYVDPVDLKAKKNPVADLVLLTNAKPGHTSPEDVEAIAGPSTRIAGPADAVARTGREGRALSAGDRLEFSGADILAVPARTTATEFFPAATGGLGYLLGFPEGRIYVAGMTDHLPEEPAVRADVAFLPVSGRYVMDAEGARRAAEAIGARTVLPLLLMGDRFYRTPGITTAPGEL